MDPTWINHTLIAAAAALVSGSIGAVVVLFPIEKIDQKILSAALGLCAGVMLGAAIFGLMLPGIHASGDASIWVITGSILSGALLMELFHNLIPHEHFAKGTEGPSTQGVRRSMLLIAAIAIHNFPEGISLGAGFLQPDRDIARGLLIGISTQNVPEGMLVAVGLIALRVSRKWAVAGVVACALVETVGSLTGSLLGQQLSLGLPLILLVCSGAMIYVVSQELIPESYRAGYERFATFSLICGLIGMLMLSMP